MLYTGADLIRSSGHARERSESLKLVPKVSSPESAESPSTNLDEETQGALLRFARFIQKEGEKKREPPRPTRPRSSNVSKQVYAPYVERLNQPEPRGQILNIFV
jgi:hypothetical protein